MLTSAVKFLCVVLLVWCSAANADLLEVLKRINEGLGAANPALAGTQVRSESNAGAPVLQTPVMATVQAEPIQSKPTEVVIPSDKRTEAAVEEAMPVIKRIVSLHRCLKNNSGLRQMNFEAVPGSDMSQYGVGWTLREGLPTRDMQYHDYNTCLRAQTLDQFSMPALNALQFRAVYFADDSGETASFSYLFMKTNEGWKIKQFSRQGR